MATCPKCNKDIPHLKCHSTSEESGNLYPGGTFVADSGGSIEYSCFSCPLCGECLNFKDADEAYSFLIGK